jgi:CheY-like chemotaxis protein
MARILVVEDSPMNQEIISRLLQREGHEVLLAGDGIEGIEVAQDTQPDLILMDMGLPRLNGFRATRQIHRIPETATIPIIALTAFTMEGEREKCLAVGCDEYATKPVDMDDLRTKMKVLLDRPRPPAPLPADGPSSE